MTLSTTQIIATRALVSALTLATTSGLFDLLAPEASHPDRINAFCDDVDTFAKANNINEPDRDAQRKLLKEFGYTIQLHGESGWIALLPGETEFLDDGKGVQNYSGFFSSEDDLLNEISSDIEAFKDKLLEANNQTQQNALSIEEKGFIASAIMAYCDLLSSPTSADRDALGDAWADAAIVAGNDIIKNRIGKI